MQSYFDANWNTIMNMPRNKTLSTAFKTALLTMSSIAVFGCGKEIPTIENGAEIAKTEHVEEEVTWKRPVHANEAALAKSIFGDKLDTKRITQLFSTYYRNDGTIADATAGKLIRYFGKDYVSDDYSKEEPENFGNFVHEMTHIWQRQASSARHCRRYYYRLAPDLSFRDYCVEQQAALVEDYARRFLHPEQGASKWYAGWYGQDTQESDALLQKIVEDHFPQVRKTRLALERKQENIQQAYNARANNDNAKEVITVTIKVSDFSMTR